jgi:hypothetical protein
MKAIAAFAIAALLAPAVMFAAEPKDAAKKKPMHLPLKGTVVTVTATLLTLKGGKGKPDRKFRITPDTKVLRGESASLAVLAKIGQTVTGSYVRSPEGADTLTKLQIAPTLAPTRKKEPPKAAN